MSILLRLRKSILRIISMLALGKYFLQIRLLRVDLIYRSHKVYILSPLTTRIQVDLSGVIHHFVFPIKVINLFVDLFNVINTFVNHSKLPCLLIEILINLINFGYSSCIVCTSHTLLLYVSHELIGDDGSTCTYYIPHSSCLQ